MDIIQPQLLVAGIVGITVLQIGFEDLIVFVATTGTGDIGSMAILIGIPFTLVTLLILLTVGVAIQKDETLR